MRTQQEISKEIVEKTKQDIPQITNYRIGGVFRLFIEVVANFIEKFYKELEVLLPNRFLQTAQGKYLDLKAEELSLVRRLPSKTRGYVVFSRGAQDDTSVDTSQVVIIDVDKIVSTRPNSRGNYLRYKVLFEEIIPKGEMQKSVLVEAEQEGSVYNVLPNVITEITTPIIGVEYVSNSQTEWVSEIGLDLETDDSLRNRSMALWRGLNGANKAAYIAWAKTVEGIGDVRVLSEARGLGTVDVLCVGTDNTDLGIELLGQVQAIIDENRPIATDVVVSAPIIVFIDLNINVVVNPAYPKDKQKIVEAVNSYFKMMSIGKDFEPSALMGMIHSIEDVKSVSITETAKRITELQVARKGNVNISLEEAKEV